MSPSTPRENGTEFFRSAVHASIPGMSLRREYDFKRSEIRVLISQMRYVEELARANRKRLEALRDKLPTRICPQCNRPVFGRPDKTYCSGDCRVRAFRERSAETDTVV